MKKAVAYGRPELLLAEDTPTPIVFKFGAKGMGPVLDPSSMSSDIPEMASIEAPLWMSAGLVRRRICSLKLPMCFKGHFRKKLCAAPGCENLQRRCRYFYRAGTGLALASNDLVLVELLLTTYQGRFADLLTQGMSTDTGADMTKLMAKLSQEERWLLGCANVSFCEHHDFKLQSRHRPGRSMKRKRDYAW